MKEIVSEKSVLYYCFGGGLGHITRFRAFCYTKNIRPHLITNTDISALCIEDCFASVSISPRECFSNKIALRNWVLGRIMEIAPDKMIIDAFPGGILGELCDLQELKHIEVEYIARILKVDVYKRRLLGKLPTFSRIWQVEKLSEKQISWLNELDTISKNSIDRLVLEYPNSNADDGIALPDNCWLIVHSGSEAELLQLWEYANDSCLLEQVSPEFAVVGQSARPVFLPEKVPYYSVYPVCSLLERVERVVSGAGFNIIQQMNNMKEKHLVLPFERPLDDQYLRVAYRSVLRANN